MDEPVKRRYRSPLRAGNAAATRTRIRHSAHRLFTAQGYTATSMRQVAAEAGVGERTLYDAFPTKAALFDHVLGVAVAGDEKPVPIAHRPWLQALVDEPDPTIALRLLAANAAQLFERAGDLIMVSIEAAAADADMRATAQAGARATHEIQLRVADGLAHRGALRPGITVAAAADILYVLLSPHTHHLLRNDRKWTPDRYRTWISEAMIRELIAA